MEQTKVYVHEFELPLDLPYETERVHRTLIAMALEQSQGNNAAAARLLGIERTSLYEKRCKYGLFINRIKG